MQSRISCRLRAGCTSFPGMQTGYGIYQGPDHRAQREERAREGQPASTALLFGKGRCGSSPSSLGDIIDSCLPLGSLSCHPVTRSGSGFFRSISQVFNSALSPQLPIQVLDICHPDFAWSPMCSLSPLSPFQSPSNLLRGRSS